MSLKKIAWELTSIPQELTDKDWENLYQFYPHQNFSPLKAKERLAARKALFTLVQTHIDPLATFDQLSISNHHFLHQFPQWVVSIGHTQSLAVAAIAPHSPYFSLGIDLELSSRPIPEGTHHFFTNERDTHQWTPLELWVIKEAAFKALWPVQRELHSSSSPPSSLPSLLLKHLWIEPNFRFGWNQLPSTIGEYTLKTVERGGRSYILAMAWICQEFWSIQSSP